MTQEELRTLLRARLEREKQCYIREPTHFVELAVEDYKRGVPKPFDVKINKDY